MIGNKVYKLLFIPRQKIHVMYFETDWWNNTFLPADFGILCLRSCSLLPPTSSLLEMTSLFRIQYRFSSVTERFFMELNTRRVDTSVARSETLSIINGMRYLKLGVCIDFLLFSSKIFCDFNADGYGRKWRRPYPEIYFAFSTWRIYWDESDIYSTFSPLV